MSGLRDFGFYGVGAFLIFAAFSSLYTSCILCNAVFLVFP